VLDTSHRDSLGDRTTSRGLLWRSSPAFQQLIRNYAGTFDLTQNAFITSGMLFSSLVLNYFNIQKPPESLVKLVTEMNSAIGGGQNVLCACTPAEWDGVKAFVDVLNDAGLIEGLRVRDGDLATDALMYTFRFTREGEGVWRAVGRPLAAVITGISAPLY